MRFDVITLFPELFATPATVGVTRRAFAAGEGGSAAVDLRLWNLRDFADDAYRRVDDRPYGGGPGMVLLVEPLQRALAAVRAGRAQEAPPAERAPVILLSPAGVVLDQARVRDIARGAGAILVCGRYEGVDQRFIDAHVDLELSLGDFVLSGGELPALVLLDAVARLQPGVLGEAQSHVQDSFSAGLLDWPHYSRPERLAGEGTAAGAGPGAEVPGVLMSGHHGDIARWRRQAALRLTAQRRPDLIDAARSAGQLTAQDEHFLRDPATRREPDL